MWNAHGAFEILCQMYTYNLARHVYKNVSMNYITTKYALLQ